MTDFVHQCERANGADLLTLPFQRTSRNNIKLLHLFIPRLLLNIIIFLNNDNLFSSKKYSAFFFCRYGYHSIRVPLYKFIFPY